MSINVLSDCISRVLMNELKIELDLKKTSATKRANTLTKNVNGKITLELEDSRMVKRQNIIY